MERPFTIPMEKWGRYWSSNPSSQMSKILIYIHSFAVHIVHFNPHIPLQLKAAVPGLLIIVTVGLLVTYILLARSQTFIDLPTRYGTQKSSCHDKASYPLIRILDSNASILNNDH